MKEIGGYLELENLIHNEYYSNAIALNLARNALIYIAKTRNIKKIYLPYFICDTVYDVCDRENIEYEFYHIDKKFQPIFNKILGESEYLYIVNYYGQIDSDRIKGYKEKYKNIIVDNVQAFFELPIDNIDTIYSCRKFFGVPDGAYLVTNAPALNLQSDNSCERILHIVGRYDSENASKFYRDFQSKERDFAKLPLMYMSKSTCNILGAVDYQLVIRKRNENWQFLHEKLKEKNKLELKRCQGPYMYPFYCEKAAQIRAEMAKADIYIPLLWPNVELINANEYEKNLAKNILPLPIDQRYNINDLKRLLDELFKLL